ncbi:hypothetical protein O181_070385 [Austropuccinia psidii MF-1]|uniref:Uncharacterized protein n=1 Tax=Austropuccinia psidii MF-1 TaxID=1389203 RepID=A0A9Q3EWD0_9BASI|nr:hypothetical protein [Austropuccinia psidii MF-1]
MKISANQPNNIIYFQDEDLKSHGKVSHIIDLECDKLHKGPIILLKNLKTFNTRANEFAPVNSFLEALKVSQVGHDGSFSFIPIEKFISLAAYRRLPAWILGICEPNVFVRTINKLVGLKIQTLGDSASLDDAMSM